MKRGLIPGSPVTTSSGRLSVAGKSAIAFESQPKWLSPVRLGSSQVRRTCRNDASLSYDQTP